MRLLNVHLEYWGYEILITSGNSFVTKTCGYVLIPMLGYVFV
jgi:hypothetical protein